MRRAAGPAAGSVDRHAENRGNVGIGGKLEAQTIE
jgi:hypothetical protein